MRSSTTATSSSTSNASTSTATDAREVARLTTAIARDGVDAHHAAVVALLDATDLASRSPVLHDVLRDRGAPDVARIRAFGRVPWGRLLTRVATRPAHAA